MLDGPHGVLMTLVRKCACRSSEWSSRSSSASEAGKRCRRKLATLQTGALAVRSRARIRCAAVKTKGIRVQKISIFAEAVFLTNSFQLLSHKYASIDAVLG